MLAHYIVVAAAVVSVAGFLLYSYANDGNCLNLNIGSVSFHFDNVLMILVAGIVGFEPAMISFLILFIGSIIIDIGHAYSVIVYLIAAIFAFAATRKGFYHKDSWQLYLLPVVLAFVLGDIQLILDGLANGYGFTEINWVSISRYFLEELPECLIAVFLCYLFFNYCPAKIRTLTYEGRFYTEGTDDIDELISQVAHSGLSRLVMGLIVIEALVLGIAAACFANALLPSVSEDAFEEGEGSVLHDLFSSDQSVFKVNGDDDTSTDGSDVSESTTIKSSDEEAYAKRQNRLRRFVLNRSGLAFDIKLIMLIINTSIPIIVIGNLFAQRRIVRPIILMSQSISDFCYVPQEQKEEELEHIRSLPIYSKNEIGVLYHSLSEMATNITNFVDKEREKDRLEADLVVAQKTSENKSNFLSSVSHELRTPINAVLGLDEMILRESKDEVITEYATDIQNAGKTLLGLVNDILDTSKLDEGKMELIPTEYELSSAINDLINMISVKARDKGLEFNVCVDEQTPHVLYGDEVRLKQIILNILTNAVKYTHQGSVTMDIGFEKYSDDEIFLLVRVKDTGIGIKEEDIDKLFSRFERIEEERNKSIEGSGLGMSIVSQLLALMGSKVEVDSVYGKGSDFHFKVLQKVVKWQPIGNFSETYKQMVEQSEEYAVSFVAPQARILVVDDTPMNLTVVKGLLKETEIQITTASGGSQALDLVRDNHYDIIFLDQRMPEMDGVETFHNMQRMSADGTNSSHGVPVIALTANAVSGSRESFLKEGFTDYLSKPIDSHQLERMVRNYLPKELICDPTEHNAKKSAESRDLQDHKSKLSSLLEGVASIDYDEAIANCGSEELLESVLNDYLEAVPAKASDIKRYYDNKDYENYTILVHALKSSSRLIGATKLSQDAAWLEECGDRAKNGDQEAVTQIENNTPALLKLYRSYYDKLTPLLQGAGDEDRRPVISQDEYFDGMRAIREFVEAFDFDSADGVVTMLNDYRIPENEAEHFDEVKRLLSAVDREALLRLSYL